MASRSRRSGEPELSPDARFEQEFTADLRSPYQRDRDRILYSGAFARLAETTQVLSPSLGHVVHNRLTHSLKVGQIARRIAEGLLARSRKAVENRGGLDPEAAEAAGFAHDLGHPPFGHIAEDELDLLVKGCGVSDGYEGNAQSFRIVTRLAMSDASNGGPGTLAGLNLTRRTLDGILKYPWLNGGNPKKPHKWGAYQTERDIFAWVRIGRSELRRSLTAEVMDWADDITFAIHDLLDFYCAGKIPMERFKIRGSKQRERLLLGMFRRMPEWKSEQQAYEQSLESLIYRFPFDADHQYGGSPTEQAVLHQFATGLISYFVASFRLGPVESSPRRAVEVLKQFTWEYVIENPELAVVQEGQRRAVREVFIWLLDKARRGEEHRFLMAYRDAVGEATTDEKRVRCVCDCVASMTEKQILQMHAFLQGVISHG